MTKHNKMAQTRAPEAKAATGTPIEVAEAFEEFMEAFEAFKQTNDERLAQVEDRLTADVVTTDKLDRINQAMDEQKSHIDRVLARAQRPAIGGAGRGLAASEHKQAFEAYVRKGREEGLRRFEAKAMSYGSDPDGGYLVPDETSTEIGKRLAAISPIRSLATVRTVSSATFKKPFAVSGPATGWVSETQARPESAAPGLSELQFPTMELYAMPAATSTLLDDAAVDIDAWLAEEVDTAFAEQEGAAFINGDGVNQPAGFLTAPVVDEDSWSWGNLGYVATGADGDFDTSNASDVLLETIYALKSGYRQNGTWVMNRKTQAAVRKLKDADGNYLWQAPATPGAGASLMGFNLVEAEDMPDIATDETAIAFGDFRRGYLVVDRQGVRVLRDPYSSKPYVLFYTTKRVGGGIQDFDAIKLVKFGTA